MFFRPHVSYPVRYSFLRHDARNGTTSRIIRARVAPCRVAQRTVAHHSTSTCFRKKKEKKRLLTSKSVMVPISGLCFRRNAAAPVEPRRSGNAPLPTIAALNRPTYPYNMPQHGRKQQSCFFSKCFFFWNAKMVTKSQRIMSLSIRLSFSDDCSARKTSCDVNLVLDILACFHVCCAIWGVSSEW